MIDALPSIPLFDHLTLDQINLLKLFFEKMVYPPNTPIIEQGAAAGYLYFLARGEVAIHYKPYDGPSLILTRLRVGDAFGWSAVVGSRFYTSSIVSETEVETIRIKGSQMTALVKQYPETGSIILERLARSVSPRWQHAREQVEALLNSR